MVELHGWITLRDTYEATDEENIEMILKRVKYEIKKLKYSTLQIKSMDGEHFIEFSSYTNHMSLDVKEIISFFEAVGNVAKGSYGLLYVYDDEDMNSYNNFMVYRLARGAVELYQDHFLSPIVPVVEDMSD